MTMTEQKTVDGYALLASAVAKSAWQELLLYMKLYYAAAAESLDDLTQQGLRLRHEAGRNFQTLQDLRKYANRKAAWFDQGNFTEWFSHDYGLYLIRMAKIYARKAVLRSKDKR